MFIGLSICLRDNPKTYERILANFFGADVMVENFGSDPGFLWNMDHSGFSTVRRYGVNWHIAICSRYRQIMDGLRCCSMEGRRVVLGPYLTLPYLWGGLTGPAVRPQHGPSAHPRHTSRSIKPLWSFGKPQEEKPMDVTAKEAAKVTSKRSKYQPVWFWWWSVSYPDPGFLNSDQDHLCAAAVLRSLY